MQLLDQLQKILFIKYLNFSSENIVLQPVTSIVAGKYNFPFHLFV